MNEIGDVLMNPRLRLSVRRHLREHRHGVHVPDNAVRELLSPATRRLTNHENNRQPGDALVPSLEDVAAFCDAVEIVKPLNPLPIPGAVSAA